MRSPFRALARRICWCRPAPACVNRRTGESRSLSANRSGGPGAAAAIRIGTGRAALAALLCTALLSGCTPPPAETKVEEPPPPEPPPPAPAPTLRAEWSFSAKGDECIATASAGVTALRVTVRRDVPIRLNVSLAPQYDHEKTV